MQQLYLQQQALEEQKRDQAKKEREDRIKNLMSAYTQNVLKNQNETKEKEDKLILDQIRRQEENAKRQEELAKAQKAQNAEKIKKELGEQIEMKKLKVSQEIHEGRKLMEKQQLEDKLQKEREEQRSNVI